MLVVIPSQAGLQQAEQQIADWIAWQEIMKTPEFPKFDSIQQERVKKSEKTSKQQAETAVKNAYELVLHLDKAGSVAMKKFTMGAQALFPTLLQEKDLRLFPDKIDAAAIMPGGLYNVWPSGDDYVRVRDLFQAFGSDYKLPKMLSAQTVYNTIADAVDRGLLAARCPRPDSSEQWFWRTKIDVVDWEKSAEAWLPQKATIKPVSARAVLPESLPGLWPDGDPGVELATVCGWFDGTKQFQEITQARLPSRITSGSKGRSGGRACGRSASGEGRRSLAGFWQRQRLRRGAFGSATRRCGEAVSEASAFKRDRPSSRRLAGCLEQGCRTDVHSGRTLRSAQEVEVAAMATECLHEHS